MNLQTEALLAVGNIIVIIFSVCGNVGALLVISRSKYENVKDVISWHCDVTFNGTANDDYLSLYKNV
jgi:hypothetical protein